jgi:hypothetical protein
MRPWHAWIAVAVVATFALGCQQAQRATRYSDDAIEAVKRILRTNSDDAAVRILDDATRVAFDDIAAVERAAVAWSGRVVPIRDRIMASLTASPDDAARVRSFVVGSTCDAFREASSWPNGQVPSWRIGEVVRENQLSSGMPDVIGMGALVADLSTSIQDALADGDIGGALPGIAQTLACAVAAG